MIILAAVLGLKYLYNLHLNWRNKNYLCLVGLFVCVACVCGLQEESFKKPAVLECDLDVVC